MNDNEYKACKSLKSQIDEEILRLVRLLDAPDIPLIDLVDIYHQLTYCCEHCCLPFH